MLNFEQLLPTLRARWLALVVTLAAIVAIVLGVSLLLPPRYEATAMLVVEMNGVDPIGGQTVTRPTSAVSTHMSTQVEIIKSHEVALGALRALGLDRSQEWREQWQNATGGGGQGEFEAWGAAQLLRKLDVRPSRESNVVTIAYTAPEPQFAAAAANAFVKSYIDTTLQMRAEPARQFNRFFGERAQTLRDALDKARARLSAYEKEHGVLVGNEPDAETARLAELTSQLVTLQDAAAEAANLRNQARSAPADMREVRNDPQVAVLTGELARQEAQLAELKADFGERHPAVLQARRTVRDVQQRLDAAMRQRADSLAAPAKVVDARLAEVQRAIEKQRTVVQKRKSERDAASALVRDVESAQKSYDAVLTRASETALESANTTPSTISIVKSATAPIWSPATLIRNLAVAGLLGLLLGIAVALRREASDRRLRSVADVTGRLRQPLLLMLPDGSAPHGEAARRSAQTRRRLVSNRPRLAAPKWGSST